MSYRDFISDHLYRRALKRLRKTDSAEVYRWANNALVSAQQALDELGQDPSPALVLELRRGILAVLAATDVLHERLTK